MKKISVILTAFLLSALPYLSCGVFALSPECDRISSNEGVEKQQSDVEFDLENMSSEEIQSKAQNKKQSKKQNDVQNEAQDEITLDDADSPQIFKLKIQKSPKIATQKENFEKENVQKSPYSFKLVQGEHSQSKDEYGADNVKLSTGSHFSAGFLELSSGFETKYREYDQKSTKKLYFNPSLKLSNRVSLDFTNTINVQNKTEDHDVGLKISPFKSNVMNFGVYTGLTRNPDGQNSQNLNFSTNFFF